MTIKYYLFFVIVSYVWLNFGANASYNKTADDQFILCNLKSYQNKSTENRYNLCRIECFTKLGNPGLCQMQLLSSCKTLAVHTEATECSKKANNSRFKSICCPLEQENKPKPTNWPETVSTIDECGKRPDVAAIVGGFDAEPNTWPWIVSIYERQTSTSEPYFICGGAIISNNYILSAAHCFVRVRGSSVDRNKYLIKLGAYRLSDKNVKFREISKIIPHQNYNTIERYYDIALLKVKSPIEFNPTISPICLPKDRFFDNNDFVGFKSKLLGWGAKQFSGSTSDTLQEVDVNIIDNRDCNRNYSQINGHESQFPFGINNQFICAGFPNGGKDSCQGDSGGPLQINVNSRWYELGIVSFGYKCAEPGFPGIYTNLLNKQFIDWIETNMKLN